MKDRLRNMWRDHSMVISQVLLALAAGLNVGTALWAANYWSAAIGWGFAGFCIGALLMNHVAHYFIQRCRFLEDMMDAVMQSHADEVGKAMAEHLATIGFEVTECSDEIVRH